MGTYISGVGHTALILWALIGGLFLSASDPLPVQTTDVSLMTSEEFAALSAPQSAPDVPSDQPEVMLPEPVEDLPVALPSAEDVTDQEQPSSVQTPEAESNPEPVSPLPEPEPIEPIVVPEPVLPKPVEDLPPLPEAPEAAPAPAPRVAPEPAATPEPDTEIADQVTPEVAPDDTADTVAEEQGATAPEEAAPEIVTEAEQPKDMTMAASMRPVKRPPRPKAPAPAAETPASEPVDPIAEALAQATAETAAPARTAPTGPPLTGGETDSFRIAVSNCWVVDVGSQSANVTVTVGFSLDKSGKVVGGTLKLLGADGGDDAASKTAFEAARRAILRCQRSGYNLPSDKYAHWQDIEMTFNPDGMRVR